MSSYVFDSFALLKVFQKDPGHQAVLRLIRTSAKKRQIRYLSIINFAEAIYLVKKRYGNAEKMRLIAAVHEMDFRIVSAVDDLVYRAAELKGDYPIAFGDAFALATALQHKAVLVTGDPEFRSVNHLVTIRWV